MNAPLPLRFENIVGLIESAQKLYRNGGLARGDLPGWTALDELYSVAPSQWTVVTGIPQSGKSEFLDALLVNLAETAGWQFAVYSPENYPTETHLVKLAEKRARKPFNLGPNPRMSEDEFRTAAFWVAERFTWLKPALNSPHELLDAAFAHQIGVEKFGVVLDPWNTLDHERGLMSETDYVSRVLTHVSELARSLKAHIWLVVHPKMLNRDRDGNRPVPAPYDISGSAHWYNKADNILTVHRQQGKDTQEVEIHVQKVRFKHCGHIGLARLMYDKVTGRYFEGPAHPIEGEFYADPERGQPAPKPFVAREPGEEG